ncbi:MAG TPA: enoyl-CoA hydratase-related protein [Ramlibacter sp.]|nr:enoyl-CoA hydratase-related protein [Ramlibacter sp.]
MSSPAVTLCMVEAGVAVVTLQRPEVHNAANEALIASLHETLVRLARDPSVRIVALRGAGRSFCAGADLAWMQRAAESSPDANVADAHKVAALLFDLANLPKPTVALVHGKALGMGVGLAACCDIAVASPEAEFGMAEVRFGLVPATVGAYVTAAVGERQARRLFLTGERFGAAEAHRMGLVHVIRAAGEFDDALASLCDQLLLGAPAAQAKVKSLLSGLASVPIDAARLELTVRHIAAARASDEGREGMAAFLQKRKPSWSGAPRQSISSGTTP